MFKKINYSIKVTEKSDNPNFLRQIKVVNKLLQEY